MKIFLALFVWIVMAAILTTGVILSVKGSFWVLGIGLLGFVAGVIKYGIFGH